MKLLALFGLLAALVPSTLQSLQKTPIDDVWVYPHASDQTDAYLRIWGQDGKSVAAKGEDTENLSYSYLRFDVSDLPKDKKLATATLTITHVAEPTWTTEIAKTAPIEARAMSGDFDEKSWSYDKLSTIVPNGDPKSIFASVSAKVPSNSDKPFTISLDLLSGKGGFSQYLIEALKSGKLLIALTSPLDPQASGDRTVYKFYSKDAEKAYRPVLELKFE